MCGVGALRHAIVRCAKVELTREWNDLINVLVNNNICT